MTADEPDEQAIDRWIQEFGKRRYLYEKLEDVVVYDLNKVLRERGLSTRIHGSVVSRVKDAESFRGKIARKNYADPLNDNRDLLGVRIVCLYPSVLEDIHQVINETFTVIQYEDKGKVAAPELWRYSSIHYDCRLPENFSGLRYDDIKGLVFEIQVRTILQDAWATVEHKLGYKNEKQIPDELKREFSALAGLFHVADQRFQFIADRMQERAQDIAKQLSGLYKLAIENAQSGGADTSKTLGVEKKLKELESRTDAIINRGSLKALLRGIYIGREHARNYDYSVFVQDLESVDITSLGALGRLLMTGDSAAHARERDRPSFGDIEFARLAVSAALPKFQSVSQQDPKR